MTSENLQKDLEQRVRNFIQDRFVWQSYVAQNFEHYRDEKVGAEFTTRYRTLIDTYCGSDKRHQGLALSSAVDHAPQEEHVVKFEHNDGIAIVFTEIRHESEQKKGWITPYEYEFKKHGNDWRLDEVYLNDGSGRYECL